MTEAAKKNPNLDSDKVYSVVDNATGATTLVRARGLQTAIDHVAAGRFAGKLLKSGELLDAVSGGAKVETAGEEAQTAAEPEGSDDADTTAPDTNDTTEGKADE